INIKECGHTSHAHRGAVLCLDCGKVSEIQPLNCLFRVFCRLGTVITVGLCHFFHSLKGADLVCDLLTNTEICSLHSVSLILDKIRLFFLNQVINTIESHTAVIADNTSSSICILKTCNDFVVTCLFHLRCIDVKYSLIVCFMIYC